MRDRETTFCTVVNMNIMQINGWTELLPIAMNEKYIASCS